MAEKMRRSVPSSESFAESSGTSVVWIRSTGGSPAWMWTSLAFLLAATRRTSSISFTAPPPRSGSNTAPLSAPLATHASRAESAASSSLPAPPAPPARARRPYRRRPAGSRRAVPAESRERYRRPRVEVSPGGPADLVAGRLAGDGARVGAIEGHGVQGVGHGEEARPERDRLPAEAQRVARAVPPLVVMVGRQPRRNVY